MTNHHRRIIKLLKAHVPGLRTTPVRENGRVVVDFTLGATTARIAMSLTPKNLDHAVRRTCADVCKALNLPKINH